MIAVKPLPTRYANTGHARHVPLPAMLFGVFFLINGCIFRVAAVKAFREGSLDRLEDHLNIIQAKENNNGKS